MLRRPIGILLAAVALTAIALVPVPAAPASAHGVSGAADVRFAQTIAGLELTVVIRASTHLPAPLNVDVFAYSPVRDARLELKMRSLGGGAESSDAVRLKAGRPGTYSATLAADRVGPHELELRIGNEQSTLPFLVLLPRTELWEIVSYGAFASAAAFLIAALISSALARRIIAVWCGGGVAIAITVAFTTALLSAQFMPTPPEGAGPAPEPIALTMAGRPNAQLKLEVAPEQPTVGADFVLRMKLYDGSTGRPVDDLVEHHAALTHVVVTSADGEFFRHVHPTRTAPGNYEVRLRAEEPGRHLAYAEFERTDAGAQLVSGEFTVKSSPDSTDTAANPAATATATATDLPMPPGKSPNCEADLPRSRRICPVIVANPAGVARPARPANPAGAAGATDPVAGRPVSIELDTKTADLQPWLGMAGHLIVRSNDGEFLGHVHEQSSMSTTLEKQPDETVGAYGPKLQFTFSFPEPGRYYVWIQYAKDFDIVTVPSIVDVAAEGGRE